MGIGVTLSRKFIETDKFILEFVENNSVNKGQAVLDKGVGNRQSLNYYNLPSSIDNAGVFVENLGDESICYNNGMRYQDRYLYDFYEFDNSGKYSEEFEFFPGWNVSDKQNIPEYVEEFFRKAKTCKFKKINRIPTQDNIKTCCLRKDIHCPNDLLTYTNSLCDHTMAKHCLKDKNIWGDSLCMEWIKEQINRPNYNFYSELERFARYDFKGTGGLLLWTLSFHDESISVIYEKLLKEYCSDDKPECLCYRKKNFDKFKEIFKEIPGPIECILFDCKNTHPRFLSSLSREIVKNCQSINCDIKINELSGKGKLFLNNQCGILQSPFQFSKTSQEDLYIPSDSGNFYYVSIIGIFCILTFLWFVFAKVL